MTRASTLKIFTTALLLLSVATQAQERGYWRAVSNTARSITGDVALSEEKLTLNFWTTTISHIRALDAAELSAVFDTDSNANNSGSLYRLNIPAEKKFLHKNTLCGSEDVQWMVAYAVGNSLQLAFFSGEKPPVFNFDAIANSTDRCGTYSYLR
jgi:hypothetical protein